MNPYFVRFGYEDTSYLVIATDAADARRRWLLNRKEAGMMDSITEEASAAGKTVEEWLYVAAMTPLGHGVYYNE